MSTPGTILLGGIVLIDEPAFMGVSTFANTGEVLMTINTRPGAEIGQIIIGLSAHQTLQLIELLQHNASACRAAIDAGKGGNKFPEKAP